MDPCVGKNPWRRKWLITAVFVPRNSHGQRSLAGYSPWGCKESEACKACMLAYLLGLVAIWPRAVNFQSAILGPTVLDLPRNLGEMQILGPHPSLLDHCGVEVPLPVWSSTLADSAACQSLRTANLGQLPISLRHSCSHL